MNIRNKEQANIEISFKNFELLEKEKKHLLSLYENLDLKIEKSTIQINLKKKTTFSKLSQIEFKNNYNRFLQIAIKITRQLKKLHDNNTLHANILNELIFIDEDDEPYLFNFIHSISLNKKAVTITPVYFNDMNIEDKSPEQLGRINTIIDFRSDLYNLGLVFYKMLLSKNPFKGKNNLDSLNKVLTYTITNENNIPPNIFNLISKLLQKEISNRYQSINGLLFDLELLSRDFSQSITLGQKDISTNLQISDKIYGRENELELLIDRYYDVCKGNSKVLCIGGYSGVGKTALIGELKNKIISTDTYCISSKFDQYNKGKPYFGIKEAFDTLVKQILLKPENELEILKEDIISCLSKNGKILTDLVPSFENIIGKQKEIQELPANENENRFHQTFLNLLKTIITVNTPLVLIIDDLQWIDFATLKLLESFINSDELQYFYLLCSYRDNEVEDNVALQNILQNNKKVELLKLQSLNKDALGDFLKDALYLSKDKIDDLVEEVYAKTRANPFFFRQFIFGLYDDNLIYFDKNKLKWSYNIDEIKNQNITENVADYILRKGLSSLDKETIRILQIASTLGATFDLKILQKIDNTPYDILIEKIQNIFSLGYLIPLNVNTNEMMDFDKFESIQIKFLHDQIQQAAYSTIKEKELLQLHYDIGIMLLENSKDKVNYFDILSHLNFSRFFFQSEKDKLKLIELNKKALYLAKSSTAYNSALNHTIIIKELLNNFDFNDCYDEFIEFELNYIELQYLTGEIKIADKNVKELFKKIKNKDDEIALRRLLTIQYTRIGRLNEAVEEGLKSLALLDVYISKDVTMDDVGKKIDEIGLMVEQIPFSKIVKLPQVEDKNILKTLDVLMEMQAASYNSGSLVFPLTILELLKLTIINGNSYFSSYIYMMYALMNTKVLKNYEMAFEAAKYAQKLQKDIKSDLLIARLNMMNSNFVMPWRNNLEEASTLREKAFNQCLACGDYYWGIHSLIFGFYSNLMSTKSLDELLTKTKSVAKLSKKIEQISQYYLCNIQINFINLLNGKNSNLIGLDKYNDFEKNALKEYDEQSYMCGKYDFIVAKLMHGFMFEEYEKALKISLNKNLDENSLDEGIFHEAFYKVFNILTILSLKIEGKSDERYDEFIKENIFFIDVWEKNAPDIFKPIKLLIEALKSYINNDIDTTMQNYEEAISLANKTDSIFLQAIINEEYGKFWIRKKNKKIADIYFNDAIELYKKWQAYGKVKHLESKISKSMNEEKKNDINVDVILRSSNTLSREIALEKVVNNILELVIKLSGAENGFLFFNEQNLEVVAQIKDGEFKYHVKKELLSTSLIPTNIISYVMRTKELTLINDTKNSDIAFKDKYIVTNKPKSILGIPLILNNETKAVIYLENFEGNNVFLEKDVEIIKHLSNQIVLSIENSLFYKELETKVQQRTKELREIKERFELTVAGSGDGLWEHDLISKISWWSPRLYEIHGYKEAEVEINFDFCVEHIHPEDRKYVLDSFQEHLKTDSDYDVIYRSKRKDGTYFYSRVRGKTQRDENGIPLKTSGSVVDITELIEAQKQLEEKNKLFEELVITDNLTKLFNRNKLDEVLIHESNRANRFSQSFSVILIDIDYFKLVNDTYGHQMGDTVLREFATILKSHSRKTDTIGRWGGEEFLIICSGTDLNGAVTLAEYLKEKISSFPFSVGEQKTASFGVSLYNKDENINKLIKRADEALYQAKRNGRNRVETN